MISFNSFSDIENHTLKQNYDCTYNMYSNIIDAS